MARTATTAKKPEPEKCLRPGCVNPVERRGLCTADYNRANALVRDGKVTWAALEKAGKAKPITKAAHTDPASEWLMDGVEAGPGKPLEAAVEEAVEAGTPPVTLWTTILAGVSKTCATRHIRTALERLAERDVKPTCECGRPYAMHDRPEPCSKFPRPRPKVPEVPPSLDDVPPPSQLTPRREPIPAGVPRPIVDAIKKGVPASMVQTQLKCTRADINAAMKVARQEKGGGALYCRCGKVYDHVGACNPAGVR